MFLFFDLNRFISEAEVGNVTSGDLLRLVLWQVMLADIGHFLPCTGFFLVVFFAQLPNFMYTCVQ